jgi:hypothetical protein
MKPSKFIKTAFATALIGLTHTAIHATTLEKWTLDAIISNASSTALSGTPKVGQHIQIEYIVDSNAPQVFEKHTTNPSPPTESITYDVTAFNNPIQFLTIDGVLILPQSSKITEDDYVGLFITGVNAVPTQLWGGELYGIYTLDTGKPGSFSANVTEALKKVQGSLPGANSDLLIAFGSPDYTISAKIASFSPIPEPSTISFMGIGLAAIIGATRRKSAGLLPRMN